MMMLNMVREYEWRRKVRSAEIGTWEMFKREFGKLFDNIISEVDSLADSDLDLLDLTDRDILVDESDEVIEQLDRILKVNNELVDN